MFTPGASSSLLSRENTFTSTTRPDSPWGTRAEVSRTSRAFSPKIARSRRSSAVSSVSPLGVTLPTKISPVRTSAPMRTMPRSSKSRTMSSPTLGISAVISSGPSLVSRASASYSSMWIEVKTSSRTTRSLIKIASSKLYPPQGMTAQRTLRPRAISPMSVAGPSAMASPRCRTCPFLTMGF